LEPTDSTCQTFKVGERAVLANHETWPLVPSLACGAEDSNLTPFFLLEEEIDPVATRQLLEKEWQDPPTASFMEKKILPTLRSFIELDSKADEVRDEDLQNHWIYSWCNYDRLYPPSPANSDTKQQQAASPLAAPWKDLSLDEPRY